MSPSRLIESGSFHELALTKMTRVLGEPRAQRLMTQILGALAIELRDADALLQFASELSKLGAFEGAVGAMLSVQAVMHGASGEPPPGSSGRSGTR